MCVLKSRELCYKSTGEPRDLHRVDRLQRQMRISDSPLGDSGRRVCPQPRLLPAAAAMVTQGGGMEAIS